MLAKVFSFRAWFAAAFVAALPAAAAASRTTYLPCSTSHGALGLVVKSHPSRCQTTRPTADVAASVDLTAIRWRGWGGATATAAATATTFTTPRRRMVAMLTVDHFQYDCLGRRYYSHLRVRARGRTIDEWLAAGCDYPQYRQMFSDAALDLMGGLGSGGVDDASVQCDYGAPGRWRCTAAGTTADSCNYNMVGHFTFNGAAVIDSARPDAAQVVGECPPLR